MPMQKRKEVLTTGEVANICHVAPRTVSKWFDTGKLRGYRIPGSRDRRIPVEQLIAFMQAHGIPMDNLDAGRCRILILQTGLDEDVIEALNEVERYEVRMACNGFDAGVIAEQFRPHVIVLLVDDSTEAVALCRNIKDRPELTGTKVLAVMKEQDPIQIERLLRQGFDGCLNGSCSLRELVQEIEQATNLIS